MTVNEAYKVLFEKPMDIYIKSNPQEIIDYIKSQTEKLTITETQIQLTDISKKAKVYKISIHFI